MKSVNDLRYKQRATIKFLVAKKESVGNIDKLLCSVYGSATADRSSSGRWAKRITASETGKTELHDLPRSGHPVRDVSPEMLQHTDGIIREYRRITTQEAFQTSSASQEYCRNLA
jgi:hypothetical protein